MLMKLCYFCYWNMCKRYVRTSQVPSNRIKAGDTTNTNRKDNTYVKARRVWYDQLLVFFLLRSDTLT